MNPHAREKFGKNPPSAVTGFIRAIKKIEMELYNPPLIFAGLRNFTGSEKADELHST